MKERLKELRKALRLTQEEFGKEIGCTNNYIYMLEKGDKPISSKLIYTICTKFRVNQDWFENGTGDMFLPSSKESEIADIVAELFNGKADEELMANLLDLVKLALELPSDKQKAFLEFARKMAESDKK